MRKLFKRHRCPPDVEITITVNGTDILGPVSGESLAYITKYGGYDGRDLFEFDPLLYHEAIPLRMKVKYIPAKKR